MTPRRDRHGRGLRAPLIPYDAPGYASRRERFDDMVADAADRLAPRWSRHWGRLEFGAEDVPPSEPSPWEDGVPIGRVFPAHAGQPARIVLYRRPIEARSEPQDREQLVRDVIAEQVARMLGRTPEEIDPGYET